MTLIPATTIDFAAKTIILAANHAVAHDGWAWTPRTTAYYSAWSRRLNRERNAHGQHAPASECLIALTGRLLDSLDPR